MKKHIKIFFVFLGIITGILFLYLIVMLISITIKNDNIAKNISKEIKQITLPSDTEYIESFQEQAN